MEKKGWVFDIQRFSLHDGPGIRTVVFLKGCPLRCLWCDNPESQFPSSEIAEFEERCIGCGRCVEVCPKKAITETNWSIDREICTMCGECVQVCPSGAREIIGKQMSVANVLAEVKKDMLFYENTGGGVTLSGGEPLMQLSFSREFLRSCKEEGIHTAIETCGAVRWDSFENILPFTDLILFDLKHMNSLKHKELVGESNELILDNLDKMTKRKNKNVVIRIPLIPMYNDTRGNITSMGRLLKRLNCIDQIDLLPYHKMGINKYKRLGRKYEITTDPPSKTRVRKVKRLLENYGFDVRVAG